MAKFKIEYCIHVGDKVAFNYNGVKRQGTVQDISQMPDIFVEGFNENNEYIRWKLGIDALEIVFSEYADSGKRVYTEIDNSEPIEVVHGENFNDLIYGYKSSRYKEKIVK